jgi:hypothetical protein
MLETTPMFFNKKNVIMGVKVVRVAIAYTLANIRWGSKNRGVIA